MEIVRIDGLYVAVHPVFTERFVADLQGSTSPFDGIDTMRVYRWLCLIHFSLKNEENTYNMAIR